jgi:two-component system, OmpR family, KDP operon response regulator KdpE
MPLTQPGQPLPAFIAPPSGAAAFQLPPREHQIASSGCAPHILVVEDHPTAQELLRDGLEASGYVVHSAGSGAKAMAILEQEPVALILLDLMLPDIDGLAVCRAIRATHAMPIIVLSAITQEHWKVELLEAGADDYLTKPAGFAELRARIRLALRRSGSQQAPAIVAQERYQYGSLLVDVPHRQVTRNDTAIQLTPTEWLLLVALCRSEQRPVSSSELIASVWPNDVLRGQSQLHTYVGQLRNKLGLPELIETVRGFGYRLRA